MVAPGGNSSAQPRFPPLDSLSFSGSHERIQPPARSTSKVPPACLAMPTPMESGPGLAAVKRLSKRSRLRPASTITRLVSDTDRPPPASQGAYDSSNTRRRGPLASTRDRMKLRDTLSAPPDQTPRPPQPRD